ncbi:MULTISPECIES: hypothetical protein [unclassified Fibrobacter]|nr:MULTISPECIES: hypothetical protein [unclassified Fibrobacter]
MSNTSKKEYVTPEIKVIVIEAQVPLLESSPYLPDHISVGREE